MSYLDIIIIAVIVLFAIVGVARGFFKSIISLLGTLVCLLITAFLTTTVCEWLLQFGWVDKLVNGTSDSLYALLMGGLPEWNGILVSADAGQISEALGGGIMSMFAQPIVELIAKLTAGGGMTDVTLQSFAAQFLANKIYWVIVAIILFVLLRVVVALLNALAKNLTKVKVIKAADKIAGLVVGTCYGFVCVVIALGLFSYTATWEAAKPVHEELKNNTVMARPLLQWTLAMMEKIDIEGLTGGLLKNPDGEETENPPVEQQSAAHEHNPIGKVMAVGEYRFLLSADALNMAVA